MSQYVTVRNKRTGMVREVTKRAYQLKKNDYVLLVGEQPVAPKPQPAVKAVDVAVEDNQPIIPDDNFLGGVTASTEISNVEVPEKQKRHRRTKAEMEAARNEG